MRVGRPKISQQGETVHWACDVEFADGTSHQLQYRVPSEYRTHVSERADAALAALIIPALRRGEDLLLDGPTSPDLLHQFQTDYAHLLTMHLGDVREVRIDAGDLAPMSQPGGGVVTGYSAGIDSFCTLRDYYLDDIPNELRITHLLYNNVGSHGRGGERLFRERYEGVKPSADRLGLPVIPIDSNVDTFYAPTDNFQRTNTPRNASVPLLLQEGFGRFYYSSSYPYDVVKVRASNDTAYNDPLTLPLMSTSGLRMLAAGSRYTRVQKTLLVAAIEESYVSLDVCVSSGGAENCSRCWKCLRTLLTLEIGGLIDRYSEVFDLELYRQERERYMASILVSRDFRHRDIVKLAKKHGFAFPASVRAHVPRALAKPLERKARRLVPEALKEVVRRQRA
jgi:hypothetical protein